MGKLRSGIFLSHLSQASTMETGGREDAVFWNSPMKQLGAGEKPGLEDQADLGLSSGLGIW